MRIAQLIYTNGIAGAEKYLQQLLPPLKEYGIECHLIVVCSTAAEKQLSDYCGSMKKLGIPSILFVTSRIGFINTARKISRYCKENDINILHAHLMNSDILAVAVKLFFNKKILLLSTKHGYKESYFTHNTENIGKAPHNFYYFLTKFLIARIDKNITISKAIAELYHEMKLTRSKMPFIHHGISVGKKAIYPEGESQFRKASPQLIIAGRLAKIKGHAYLFDAMPKIIAQFPAVHLLVMGEGAEHENLEKKAELLGIQNNISFIGFKNDPYSYIENSDLIVLPSLYEPFGLVYIESFALKTPVVAFDVKACNEIIVNNDTGILVPVKDIEGLANSIISLLQNPDELERLARNGYNQYLTYYNTERMIKDTVDWYRKIGSN